MLEPESPLYRFNHWQNLHDHPAGHPISSQQSSDLFGQITDDQIHDFVRRQSKRRIPDEYWAYDSTSLSSYSQGLKQVRYGHNKLPEGFTLVTIIEKRSCSPGFARGRRLQAAPRPVGIGISWGEMC
ncbi:hypothetical protein [Schleiferilactobacillus perolens]|uniref:hypothetical protein n=1 Tax=Schleiferilactobacillus perolens TaxID=100468 RepID=UPI0039ED7741